MPFRSQKQRSYFHYLKSKGKMDQATIDKWEEHTPKGKELPERLHKKAEDTMRGFWLGFQKRAEENFVPANSTADVPGAPEKMLKWNQHGGVDPRSPEDLQAAEAAGLVTLPPEVAGASCETCMHFRPITPELNHGFCTNPQVKQDVTGNMHCINWGHPGVHNPVEAAAEEAQAAQVDQAMGAQQGMPQDPSMMGMGMGQQPGAGPQPAQGQASAMGQGQATPQAETSPKGPAMQEEPSQEIGGPVGETANPSAVGRQSGLPPGGGPQATSNPLVAQALDDFQGQGATAGPTGGDTGGGMPQKPKKKSSEKKDSGKSSKGHTININVDKGSEKTSSQDFWKGIVDGY